MTTVAVAGEDERARQAATALEAPTPEARAAALGRLGVSVVVVDRGAPGESPEIEGELLVETAELTVVGMSQADERRVPSSWVVAMAVAWAAFAGLPAAAALAVARRLSRRRATNLPEMS